MVGQVHSLVQQAHDFDGLLIEAEDDHVGRRAHQVIGAELSSYDPQGVEAKIIDLGGTVGRSVGLLVQGFNREGDQAAIASGRKATVAGGAVGKCGVNVSLGAGRDKESAHVRRVGGRGCPARP